MYHGGTDGQFPLHTTTAGEALLGIAAFHLVDGELILAQSHFLALEVLPFLGGQFEVRNLHGGRTGKVVGRDVLGHREVHHIEGIHEIDGVALGQVGTPGLYTEHHIVFEVHLILDLVPRNLEFVFCHVLRKDRILGQRLFQVGLFSAVEHLHGVFHLQIVRIITHSAEIPRRIPFQIDIRILIKAAHLVIGEIGGDDFRIAEDVKRVVSIRFDHSLGIERIISLLTFLVFSLAFHELEDAQGTLALVGDRDIVHGRGARLLGSHLCHVGLAHLELILQCELIQREHGRGQVATLIDYRVLVHGRVGLLAGGGEQLHDAHGVGIGGCSRIAGHHRLCPRELREACLHLGHREVAVAHADYGREEGGSRCLVAHDEIVSAANRVAARHGLGILGVMPLVGLEMDFVVSLGEQTERAVHVSFHEGLGNLHGRGGDMVEEVLHVGSGQRIAASSRNGEGLVGLVLRGRGDAESVIGHDVL